jgi:hypothetical protein
VSRRLCAHAGRLDPVESDWADAPIPDTATAATKPIKAIPIRSRTPSAIWIAAARKRRRRFAEGNKVIP